MRSPQKSKPIGGIHDPRNPVNRDDSIGDLRYI